MFRFVYKIKRKFKQVKVDAWKIFCFLKSLTEM